MGNLQGHAVRAAKALPAKWDGVKVEWAQWEPANNIIMCPPRPQEPCPTCGLIRPRAVARGIRRKPRVGFYSALYAYRCTNCGSDVVHEFGSRESWILDESDYGPEGSRA